LFAFGSQGPRYPRHSELAASNPIVVATPRMVHQQEIESLLMEIEHYQQQVEEMLAPGQVLDRLNRLPEVLALNNPTLGNLELSLHIDRIDCFKAGKVVMRTCKLGALAGAAEFLTEDVARPTKTRQVACDGTKRAVPRRRARLRVEQAEGNRDLKASADTAADPNRFAGLSEEWFWEDVFQIPEKTWPFQEMAIGAATRRPGQTHEKLAENFGVTVPTIRKALRYAAEVDERFRELPSKMPRDRWHEDHAHEVAAKKADGLGTDELAAFFGKSDTTIRKALEHARKASAPEAGEAGAA
jgi:DNA-directed RNA polymerase specialized sigma24 family protein